MIDPENWLLAGGRKVRNFTNGLHIDALELGILSGPLTPKHPNFLTNGPLTGNHPM